MRTALDAAERIVLVIAVTGDRRAHRSQTPLRVCHCRRIVDKGHQRRAVRVTTANDAVQLVVVVGYRSPNDGLVLQVAISVIVVAYASAFGIDRASQAAERIVTEAAGLSRLLHHRQVIKRVILVGGQVRLPRRVFCDTGEAPQGVTHAPPALACLVRHYRGIGVVRSSHRARADRVCAPGRRQPPACEGLYLHDPSPAIERCPRPAHRRLVARSHRTPRPIRIGNELEPVGSGEGVTRLHLDPRRLIVGAFQRWIFQLLP